MLKNETWKRLLKHAEILGKPGPEFFVLHLNHRPPSRTKDLVLITRPPRPPCGVTRLIGEGSVMHCFNEFPHHIRVRKVFVFLVRVSFYIVASS